MAVLSERESEAAFRERTKRVCLAVLTLALLPLLIWAAVGLSGNQALRGALDTVLPPLIFGLVSWGLAVVGILSKRRWRGLSCLSFACCAAALYFPVMDLDYRVEIGDLSAVMDIAWGWRWGAVALLTGAAVLNLAAWLINRERK